VKIFVQILSQSYCCCGEKNLILRCVVLFIFISLRFYEKPYRWKSCLTETIFKSQLFVNYPFRPTVGQLHFVLCAGHSYLSRYDGHWRSLPDYESSKEWILKNLIEIFLANFFLLTTTPNTTCHFKKQNTTLHFSFVIHRYFLTYFLDVCSG
jgi:hypothetical protein